MSGPAPDELTIDELAQRTGLTTRNIRAYQSRGMIQPPAKHGRTGYYGLEHLERLELIRELREDGLALDLIQRMLEISGGEIAGVNFARTVLAQYSEAPMGEPRLYSLPEIAELWGTTDFALIAKAEEAGIMRLVDDDKVEVTNRQIAEVGQTLLALGMPAGEMLDVLLNLRNKMRAIAEDLRDIFENYVWDPFEAAGLPANRWDAVAEDLERLRPIADEVMVSLYRQAIDQVVSEAFDSKLKRLERGRSN